MTPNLHRPPPTDHTTPRITSLAAAADRPAALSDEPGPFVVLAAQRILGHPVRSDLHGDDTGPNPIAQYTSFYVPVQLLEAVE